MMTKDEGFQRIDVEQVEQKMKEGWTPFILDVREPQEAEIVRLEWTDLLQPHTDLEEVLPQLPRDRDLLVYCRSGRRSVDAILHLLDSGFEGRHLFNMEGGILDWARKIDTSLPTY